MHGWIEPKFDDGRMYVEASFTFTRDLKPIDSWKEAPPPGFRLQSRGIEVGFGDYAAQTQAGWVWSGKLDQGYTVRIEIGGAGA